MRSHQISFRLSHELYRAVRKVMRESGCKNQSSYWQSLAIMAVLDQRRLRWVPEIANAKPNRRDYIIKEMLAYPLSVEEIEVWLKKHDGK